MELQIRRLLIRTATEEGWTARRDGRSFQECPHTEIHRRQAWQAGWQRANLQLF